MKPNLFPPRRNYPRRAGFTLMQVLMVTAILGVLAALLFPAFGRASRAAQRQKCDVQLKSVALALDAWRQQHGNYPASLQELQSDGFLTDAAALHCPRDPRGGGSYNDFYTTRAASDDGQLPVVCCPFHEDTDAGNQARLGRFTTQFATRPATLTLANAVSVTRPGQNETGAPGFAGMTLHGGDLISTGALGTGLITFADGSTARLQSGSRVTVLQSFLDGQSGAPLYTLVRQLAGDVTYTVHHGSRFDVATLGATAGARGTQFRIRISGDGSRPQDTNLWVIEGKVVFSSFQKSGLAPLGRWLSVANILELPRWLLG